MQYILKHNYIIPIEINKIFSLYEDQIGILSKKLCNSSYIQAYTQMINELNSDLEFTYKNK